MKYGNNVDFARYELQNIKLQSLSAAPSSPVEGLAYYDTTLHQFGVYQNTSWVYLSNGGNVSKSANASASNVMQVSGGADKSLADFTSAGGIVKVSTTGVVSVAAPGTDYVTGNSSNTFTNKNFDANGTGNTVSNLETADFAVNVIDTDTTLAANSDTRIASQKAAKAYIDAKTTSALVYTGGIDASTNPNYPSASKGAFYKITVAGKIGGASGIDVQVGDSIIANTTNVGGTQAAVGANWDIVQANVDQATTATLGLVTLATSTEASAKSSTTKAVTPSALAAFIRGYAVTIGDASTTAFTITHNLGTLDIQVQVRLISTGEQVLVDNTAATTNTSVVTFGVAPASNTYRVTVFAI